MRRTSLFIEESLYQGTKWAVFEPNGEALWGNVRRTIDDFLLNEFRSGALLGAKPEQAYFVRCDAATNPAWETDAGRVTCLVGLQPPFPAEFVIVRIGVTRSGIEVEEKEAQDV